MGKNKKKKKPKVHIPFNRKIFLAPESITSMSAIHTKIKADGIGIIRISDCNNSIRLWNDLNNVDEVKEMLKKIDSLVNILNDYRNQVKVKHPMFQ